MLNFVPGTFVMGQVIFWTGTFQVLFLPCSIMFIIQKNVLISDAKFKGASEVAHCRPGG